MEKQAGVLGSRLLFQGPGGRSHRHRDSTQEKQLSVRAVSQLEGLLHEVVVPAMRSARHQMDVFGRRASCIKCEVGPLRFLPVWRFSSALCSGPSGEISWIFFFLGESLVNS